MSKQQDQVTNYLKMIYSDLQSEVVLSKITGVIDHNSYRVDIWIPCIRCVVEVHGIQHFKPSSFGMGLDASRIAFHDQLHRDHRLKEICKKFNLNYEQIDYDENVTLSILFKRFNKYDNEELFDTDN
jgi:hypothetical protein